MSQPIPKEQRALVLQGGGALGAYEAGVFKVLYERFIKPSNKSFDIVAGVSIGAVNASILVNHVIQNNNRWDQSVETLYNFWDSVSFSPTMYDPLSWPLYLLDNNPILAGWFAYQEFFRKALEKYYYNYEFFTELTKIIWQQEWPYIPIWRREEWPIVSWISWKENWREELPWIWGYFLFWPDNYGPVALSETRRRYYSWKNFLLTGTPNVYTPFILQPDLKFFDLFNPYSIIYRVGNEPLIRTIKKYWYPDAPIKTSLDSNQPRLLLVSVDIQSGTSSTFDSYEKGKDEYGDAICRTVYGEEKTKYTIEYPEGIGMKHLMTSMAFHLIHKYPELEVKKVDEADSHSRPFWDGIYLSNTPLRELLQAHKDYWKVRNPNGDPNFEIPKLKVYIVDLYPTAEKGIPKGFDEINDRQYDVLFHDKTRYDEKVANIVTDYVNIGKGMKKLLEKTINTVKDPDKKKALEEELDQLLKIEAKSETRDGKHTRKYDDLLKEHFDVEVVRIERSEDDETDIYGKAFDFSHKTIDQLRNQGEEDTKNMLNDKYRDISW